ncbi:MAG: transketolase C-terminal domain-containing protein [Candidatus Hydrogenedentes bacterium]|nr:transketolase C-terminal domain-containing protein [Candidatus Hydrogenedentota bacterium]
MRDAFFRTLVELASEDERVIFITGDLGFKLVNEFATRFPTRFFNAGVAEANMVSVAAGLALSGKIPFVYSIVPFITARCVEQIRNDLCNMGAPVIVVGVGGGYSYGENGPTHHGIDDIALMRAIPEMTVVCPCDPVEAADAMRALVAYGKPAYLRLGRAGERSLPRCNGYFELGRPSLVRTGEDIAIVASGAITSEALNAADKLNETGIDVAVWSLHTVKPIESSVSIIAQARYRLVIAVEEHGPCGGMTEALSARMHEVSSGTRVARITAPDTFTHPVGSQGTLRKTAHLDADGIAERVLTLVGGKN